MHIGRIYTIPLDGIVISTAITVLEFTMGSAVVGVLLEAKLTQNTSETSQQEELDIVRKSAAGTGTSVTPLKLQTGDPAFAGTSRRSMSAEGTVTDVVKSEGFNVLNGWHYLPLPESRIYVAPSGILGIRFSTAPASQTWSGYLVVGEIG